MKKIETIWHHLLWQAVNRHRFRHTQQGIAQEFAYSLSTIHHALKIPTQMGAIRKTGKFFVLEDFSKLLYYWASYRHLANDIIYQTFVAGAVREIEAAAPPKAIFAAYSAAKKILKEPPADYAKVYLYAPSNQLVTIQRRFPEQNRQPANLFILKAPSTLTRYGSVTTIIHTFVDIWNLNDWYAKEFTQRLEEKINGLLSQPDH